MPSRDDRSLKPLKKLQALMKKQMCDLDKLQIHREHKRTPHTEPPGKGESGRHRLK
jgi:hypothetical protein